MFSRVPTCHEDQPLRPFLQSQPRLRRRYRLRHEVFPLHKLMSCSYRATLLQHHPWFFCTKWSKTLVYLAYFSSKYQENCWKAFSLITKKCAHTLLSSPPELVGPYRIDRHSVLWTSLFVVSPWRARWTKLGEKAQLFCLFLKDWQTARPVTSSLKRMSKISWSGWLLTRWGKT